MRKLVLLALLTALPAVAQPIDDPTRPPAGIAGDGSAAAAGGLGLTSVLLPKKGRAAAVIDGQLVELGGTVRGARVVAITEGSVVLAGPEGRERLYLTPDVEKKINVNKAAPRRHKE